jgi:hypothetical protein
MMPPSTYVAPAASTILAIAREVVGATALPSTYSPRKA